MSEQHQVSPPLTTESRPAEDGQVEPASGTAAPTKPDESKPAPTAAPTPDPSATSTKESRVAREAKEDHEAKGGKDSKSALEKVGPLSVYLAIVIFFINMMGAWSTVSNSSAVVGRALIEPGRPTAASRALDVLPAADGNGHSFINHLLSAELQLRTVQNQQTISVAAMSAAFALLAIGFALFVLGAEGAFKVAGKLGDGQNLVLKSTAPGLLCFLLAALVIIGTLAYGKLHVIDGPRDIAAQLGPASGEKPKSSDASKAEPSKYELGPAGPPRSEPLPRSAGPDAATENRDGGTKP